MSNGDDFDVEKHALAKKILDDQVHELRKLRQSYPDLDAPTTPVTASTRIKHLVLLEECNNMWDVIPLSKAINHLHESFPPHLVRAQNNDNNATVSVAEEAKKKEYEESIPFETASDELCFTILLLYKTSFTCLYDYEEDNDKKEGSSVCEQQIIIPLLRMDQSPKDAIIENGIVCGLCLKVSPKHRCSRCKSLSYCHKDCQSSHWKLHKKACRPNKLKSMKDDDYSRETRQRYCQENGAAIMFIRDHPYPPTIEGVQSIIGSGRLPWYYSEAIHQEFAKVYSYVSKNTFQVYARALGKLLYDLGEERNHQSGKGGGREHLDSAFHIILKVITSHPTLVVEQQKDRDRMLVAEVMARQCLDFAWDGIGDWMC